MNTFYYRMAVFVSMKHNTWCNECAVLMVCNTNTSNVRIMKYVILKINLIAFDWYQMHYCSAYISGSIEAIPELYKVHHLL